MSALHVAAGRAVAAAIALFGVVLLLVRGQEDAAGQFVYFTTQSNLLVGLCFLAGALAPWLPRLAPTDVVRGATTLYIMVTFLVFHLMLANPASGFGNGSDQFGSLQNIIVHTVTPMLALLDWVLIRGGRLKWRWAAAWLLYPLGYLAFALIRGAVVHKYPYPFLDVRSIGYQGVTIVSLALTVAFWLLGTVVVLIGGRRPEKSGPKKSGPKKSGPEKTGPERSGPEGSGPEGSGPEEPTPADAEA